VVDDIDHSDIFTLRAQIKMSLYQMFLHLPQDTARIPFG
jgi:hypothetical protein